MRIFKTGLNKHIGFSYVLANKVKIDRVLRAEDPVQILVMAMFLS